MCYNFVNIMYENNYRTKNIHQGKQKSPVFKFKDEMQQQEPRHKQNRYSSGIKLKAFCKISLQQSNIAALQSATRAIDMQQHFTGAGEQMSFQPMNCIDVNVFEQNQLHASNIQREMKIIKSV